MRKKMEEKGLAKGGETSLALPSWMVALGQPGGTVAASGAGGSAGTPKKRRFDDVHEKEFAKWVVSSPSESRRCSAADVFSPLFFCTGCHPSPTTTLPNDSTHLPLSPNQLPPLVPSPAVDDAPPSSLQELLATDPLSPFKLRDPLSRERRSRSLPSCLSLRTSLELSRSRARRARRGRFRSMRRGLRLRGRGRRRRKLSRGSWRCRRLGGAQLLGGG